MHLDMNAAAKLIIITFSANPVSEYTIFADVWVVWKDCYREVFDWTTMIYC
jgi:hypothetical protein